MLTDQGCSAEIHSLEEDRVDHQDHENFSFMLRYVTAVEQKHDLNDQITKYIQTKCDCINQNKIPLNCNYIDNRIIIASRMGGG